MQALDHNDAVKALGDWQLNQACKAPVSFLTLARSSTSRAAIAAGSGITSLQKKSVLIKVAQAIGLSGIIQV